jgi:hypothetical protein
MLFFGKYAGPRADRASVDGRRLAAAELRNARESSAPRDDEMSCAAFLASEAIEKVDITRKSAESTFQSHFVD